MWREIVGERSSAVDKLARVRAPKGVRLRPRPGAASDIILPFDTLVRVQRRTDHGWCWIVSMEAELGKTGFCEEQFLAVDPPEPSAHLYRVQEGDRLGDIAARFYGKSFKGGNDARLYVQALYEANKHTKGVYLDEVDLSWTETWHRRAAEEWTLAVYKGVKVRKGLALWVPSEQFIARLKASGAITSGSSEFSKAWRAAKEFVEDAIWAVKYVAGFIIGLLEGAWDAIVDLFKGALDMIEAVAKVIYHLVTGNPGAVKDMLLGWVKKLAAVWTNRSQIAGDFMQKWEADDGWDRGRFQGEVLGWVMMTALIIIVTAGYGAIPQIAGKWAWVVRVLKTVDALGDITTYAAKVVRMPAKAIELARASVGRQAAQVGEDVVEKTARAGESAAAKTGRNLPAFDAPGTTLARETIELGTRGRHTVLVQQAGGKHQLWICTHCSKLIDRVDEVLATVSAKGPTKSAHARLTKLRAQLVDIERQLDAGKLKVAGLPRRVNQIGAHLRDLSKKHPDIETLGEFAVLPMSKDFKAFLRATETPSAHQPASSYSGGKHVRGPTNAVRQTNSTKGGPGQYFATLSDGTKVDDAMIQQWERRALDLARRGDGDVTKHGGGHTFHAYVDVGFDVGYADGTVTRVMRVEWSSGTVHSHPR